MKRIDRLLGMALLLSARRRLRAEDLSDSFRVSVRTVYRDVRALQEAGFSLVGTPGDGYQLPQEARLRPLSLGSDEAEALVMGARLLESIADDRLRERLQRATAKLEAALTPHAVRRLRDHRRSVMMVAPHRKSGPLGTLLDAVNERRVLEIEYDGIARQERTVREIEPLGIMRFGNVWLLAAYCHLRKDLRVFRSDRIAIVRDTGRSYEPRPDHTLDDFVKRTLEESDRRRGQ